MDRSRFKKLLILADDTVESQWILSILKAAAEAEFTDIRFAVR